MTPHRALAILACAMLSGCAFNFDRPAQVKDRRILAVQVEPPELVPRAPLSALTVRALVVDPGGQVAETDFDWWSCTLPATAGGSIVGGDQGGFGGFGGPGVSRCPDSDATSLVEAGTEPLDSFEQSVPVPDAVAAALSSGGRAPTPSLQVQLRVGSADGDLFAVKKVTVSSTLPPGQEPNANPQLSKLTLDGKEWPLGGPIILSFGQCPDDKREPVASGSRREATVCTHEINPVFDDSQTQSYQSRDLSGQPATGRERLRFSWFSDQGEFQSGTTSQPDPNSSLPNDRGLFAVWREPATNPNSATFWVVVRDGRGGESWQMRQIEFE